MATVIKINSVDYSSYFYVGEYGDYDHVYLIDYAKLVMVDDSSHTLAAALRIAGKKKLEIIVDGTEEYTGIVEDWRPSEEGLITIYSIDYSIQLHGKPVTKYDMAGQTASQAITDLISTYGDSLFTSSISTTTTTYDDVFYYMTPLEIMQELCLRESHSLRLTPSLQWVSKPRSDNDLGISYTEGTDFYAPSFPKVSHRIRNSMYAIDSSGQVYAKVDLTSVNNHFNRTGFMDLPDATSESQIRNYLNARVTRDSDSLTPGKIDVPQDFSLEATGLVRINYAQLVMVDELAYIIGLVQDLDTPTSQIELVNYNPDLDESISRLLYDRRQLQKRNMDTALPLLLLYDMEITVGVTVSVVVERQDSVVDVWDEGVFDTAKWDSAPDAWDSVVTSTMIPMNRYLDRLRDLLQGKAVNALDAANTKLELGSGTTAVTVTDTALASAISGTSKVVDSGYPRDGAAGEAEHQVSVDDSDVVSFTAQEIGLFENSNLMARVVLSSSLTKLENQTFRVRSNTSFSDPSAPTLMTRYLNKIRDLLQGKAVNALDAATKIQYGTGTTTPTVTDTDLATPIAATLKTVDSGFPRDGSDLGAVDHQTSIMDSDLTSMSATEIGVKEGTSLMLRKVLDSAAKKAIGETVRTRITTRFVEV